MGLCFSGASDGNTTNTTAGSGSTNASANQGTGSTTGLSLGSLGPVAMGNRDQSFPSVIGPPSLRKQPSHQAVVSMTNLLNSKCRFAGTVTEEDQKLVAIPSADGDYRSAPAAAAVPGAAPTASLVLIVKGSNPWRVTLSLGASANPKPSEIDGEETIPISAEMCAAASAAADYRMSSCDVEVHSLGSLRLIEDVTLRLVGVNDNTRVITITGSLSWRLPEADKP